LSTLNKKISKNSHKISSITLSHLTFGCRPQTVNLTLYLNGILVENLDMMITNSNGQECNSKPMLTWYVKNIITKL